MVESWERSKEKQSYTHIISKNASFTFTWAFQRINEGQDVSTSLCTGLYSTAFLGCSLLELLSSIEAHRLLVGGEWLSPYSGPWEAAVDKPSMLKDISMPKLLSELVQWCTELWLVSKCSGVMTPGWFPCLSFQSRQFINDMAKIYSITVTNAVDGVASSCRACALGSKQSGSSCVPCPAGHYIEKETSQCKECPVNTFLSIHQVYGREACIPCGPGSKSTKVQKPSV